MFPAEVGMTMFDPLLKEANAENEVDSLSAMTTKALLCLSKTPGNTHTAPQ